MIGGCLVHEPLEDTDQLAHGLAPRSEREEGVPLPGELHDLHGLPHPPHPPHELHAPVPQDVVPGHHHQRRREGHRVRRRRARPERVQERVVRGGARREAQPREPGGHVAVQVRVVRAAQLGGGRLGAGEEGHQRHEPAEPHGVEWSARAPGAPEKRTLRWCARTPPADSPATKTRPGSASSDSQGSAPPDSEEGERAAWPRSQRRTAAASSMAAGRRCSGARR
ncbi:hypothetical protein GQ55_6G184600 [Panicum hallii var. hallii]|uniref:Uncharacterized protein n=1 Tax=Panicum hallii var. hallii TaxID=1504633 RepID=A0A2T7D7A5_9POAL|nr:hypothetical protein GQ55_6G184600 [Panicum hallii var. hallii]